MVISSPHWWEPEARKLDVLCGFRFAAAETGMWISAYAASLLAGVLALGGTGTAVRNTRAVVGVERALGLFREVQVHELSRSVPGVSPVLSAYYVVLFGPVSAGVLLWMVRRHRATYCLLRTRMLLSLALALPFFVLLPAVPPRLLPGLGVADTVGLGTHGGASFLGVHFNPYAAIPSMHVGWAVLLALGWMSVVETRWARQLIAVHPAVMALSVVATGNHLLTDAVLGTGIAFASIRLTGRRRRRLLRRRALLAALLRR